MILGVDREPVLGRVGRDPVRDRPRGQHAVVLEPQVPVQPRRVVLLDDEPARRRTAHCLLASTSPAGSPWSRSRAWRGRCRACRRASVDCADGAGVGSLRACASERWCGRPGRAVALARGRSSGRRRGARDRGRARLATAVIHACYAVAAGRDGAVGRLPDRTSGSSTRLRVRRAAPRAPPVHPSSTVTGTSTGPAGPRADRRTGATGAQGPPGTPRRRCVSGSTFTLANGRRHGRRRAQCTVAASSGGQPSRR